MAATLPRSTRVQSLASSMLRVQQENASLLATPMVSVPEFAVAMNITTATAHRWLHASKVKGFRTGEAGWYRIPISEIARLKGLQ